MCYVHRSDGKCTTGRARNFAVIVLAWHGGVFDRNKTIVPFAHHITATGSSIPTRRGLRYVTVAVMRVTRGGAPIEILIFIKKVTYCIYYNMAQLSTTTILI